MHISSYTITYLQHNIDMFIKNNDGMFVEDLEQSKCSSDTIKTASTDSSDTTIKTASTTESEHAFKSTIKSNNTYELDIIDIGQNNEHDSLIQKTNPLSISSSMVTIKKIFNESSIENISNSPFKNKNINDIFNFSQIQQNTNLETSTIKERMNYNTNGKIITITFVLLLILFAFDIYTRIKLYLDTKEWDTFLYILMTPFVFLLAFSFFNFIVFGIKNIIFNVNHCAINTKYYSCIKPNIPQILPHVTIQIPIYKESFETVIVPSLESLLQAMNYYRQKGGCVNIYVNDDGYIMLNSDEQLMRRKYYAKNNIGWIARPASGRQGKFKKGSNMNYAIKFSEVYTDYMTTEIDPMLATLNHYNNACCAGGDVSIGDIILLVDSDTIVPKTCIYDTVGEFDDEELAFTQHLTTPLEENDNSSWCKLISHFTKMIYELAFIQVVLGGDPSPLVGHNAFIRTKYLKNVCLNNMQYWNENTVCEDFDLSLRFQCAGYYGRYISYTGDKFKEGVSPTYCDEIVRFKKYALGTGEITFNKFSNWCSHGIFSSTLKQYMKTSNIPWYSKILLLSYICSYFIMALTPLSLIVITVQLRFCEKCNTDNVFNITLGMIIVFSVFLPLTTTIYRWKLHNYDLIEKMIVLKNEYLQGCKMGLFFGSLCVHMLFSLTAYMFGMNEIFLSSRKEKPTWGKINEYKYILKSYWNVFVFVIIFECLFVLNYMYGGTDKFTIVAPTIFTLLHLCIPFLYS